MPAKCGITTYNFFFFLRHGTNLETRIKDSRPPFKLWRIIKDYWYYYTLQTTGKALPPIFQQNKNNAKITELFPDPYTSNYNLRLPRKYNNYVCKTYRFKHSFLPQMILKENNKIV